MWKEPVTVTLAPQQSYAILEECVKLGEDQGSRLYGLSSTAISPTG